MTVAQDLDALGEAAAALPDFARSLGMPEPSGATRGTLAAMLRALPPGAVLPRLASDTDGCVLMRWSDGGPALLAVTVEGSTVHATLDPGARSTHLEPFVWDGAWPSVLTAHMMGDGIHAGGEAGAPALSGTVADEA